MVFPLKYVANGYELFTSLALFAAAVPTVAVPFQELQGPERRRQAWNAVTFAGASAAAFVVAIIFHGRLMADSVPAGLGRIWSDGVLKRT